MTLNSSRDPLVLIEGHSPDVNLKIGAQLLPIIVRSCIEMSTCIIKHKEKRTLKEMDLGK